MKRCPACGFQNEEIFKFCLECGSTIPDDEPAPVAVAPAPAPAPVAVPVPERAPVRVPEPEPEPAAPVALDLEPEPVAPVAAAVAPEVQWLEQEGPHEEIDKAPFMGGAATLACHSCGASLDDEAVFCPNCGTKYRAPEKVQAGTRPKVMVPAHEAERQQAGELVKIREDGSRGKSMPLYAGITLIGREKGDLTFPQDVFLSPTHCKLTLDDGGLSCEDLASENGVYMRVSQPITLAHDDVFRVGQELLRFELLEKLWAGRVGRGDEAEVLGSDAKTEAWAVLSQLISPKSFGRRFALANERSVIGRENGDVTFPEDGYISRTHAEVVRADGGATLRDLGSSNGTYIRLRGRAALPSGSLIMIGQQLFLVQY
jgi:pSer/pThr/pTyr-binding forkhead associated (FHA) protein